MSALRRLCRRLHLRLHLHWLQAQRLAAQAAADRYALDPDPRSGVWMANAVLRVIELGLRIQALQAQLAEQA